LSRFATGSIGGGADSNAAQTSGSFIVSAPIARMVSVTAQGATVEGFDEGDRGDTGDDECE
jgi:hypothetical protein